MDSNVRKNRLDGDRRRRRVGRARRCSDGSSFGCAGQRKAGGLGWTKREGSLPVPGRYRSHDDCAESEARREARRGFPQDVLARFNYLLDRRGRRLEIEEDGDAALSGTPVPFNSRGGKIYVQTAGGALRLMLDSGIPYPVLYEDVVSKVELTLGAWENKAAESGIGCRTLRPARLAALAIGDARIRNLQVYLTKRTEAGRPEDGFLPVRLFDAVYVNNAKAFLILNPHRAR